MALVVRCLPFLPARTQLWNITYYSTLQETVSELATKTRYYYPYTPYWLGLSPISANNPLQMVNYPDLQSTMDIYNLYLQWVTLTANLIHLLSTLILPGSCILQTLSDHLSHLFPCICRINLRNFIHPYTIPYSVLIFISWRPHFCAKLMSFSTASSL